MPKRPNPMKINKALSYSIKEAALALDVTPATIRNYVRRGLPIMASQRPYPINGEALRQFLLDETQRGKRPLKCDELFCPTCGGGRRPFGMMVDLFSQAGKSSRLTGLCEVCEGPSQRIIGNAQTKEFATIFDIAEQGTGAA